MPPVPVNRDCMEEDCSEELIITVNKEYDVSVTIRIKDGSKAHSHSFKTALFHNGTIDDPKFELMILDEFKADIEFDAEQTTLPVEDKPSVEPKKITVDKAAKK